MISEYLSPNNFIKIYEGCFDGSRGDSAGRLFAAGASPRPTLMEDIGSRGDGVRAVGLRTVGDAGHYDGCGLFVHS